MKLILSTSSIDTIRWTQRCLFFFYLLHNYLVLHCLQLQNFMIYWKKLGKVEKNLESKKKYLLGVIKQCGLIAMLHEKRRVYFFFRVVSSADGKVQDMWALIHMQYYTVMYSIFIHTIVQYGTIKGNRHHSQEDNAPLTL